MKYVCSACSSLSLSELVEQQRAATGIAIAIARLWLLSVRGIREDDYRLGKCFQWILLDWLGRQLLAGLLAANAKSGTKVKKMGGQQAI